MTISLNANHQNRLRAEMGLKNKESLTYAIAFELASYDASQKWQLSNVIPRLQMILTVICIDFHFMVFSLLFFSLSMFMNDFIDRCD